MNLKQAADKVISEWFITGGYPDTTEERRLIAEAIHELQKASAAAPQVVADERALFEVAVLDTGFSPDAIKHDEKGVYYQMDVRMMRQGWLAARAALAAAPVQAQEPVMQVRSPEVTAWDDVPYKEQYDRASKNGFEVRCLYRAPVQPVAVPDGCKSELSAYQYWASKQDGGFAPIDAWMGRAALAAPAAQGDAKEVFQHTGGKLYEKLGEVKAKVGDTGWWNAVRYRSLEDGKEYVTDSDRWACSFAAIAAKAAS